MARPETVVDYDAWKRGYMPPTEHVLIDQLAYRGARVVMSSDWGEGNGAVWIVLRDGIKIGREARDAMHRMIDLFMDQKLQELAEEAQSKSQSKGEGDEIERLQAVVRDREGEIAFLKSDD